MQAELEATTTTATELPVMSEHTWHVTRHTDAEYKCRHRCSAVEAANGILPGLIRKQNTRKAKKSMAAAAAVSLSHLAPIRNWTKENPEAQKNIVMIGDKGRAPISRLFAKDISLQFTEVMTNLLRSLELKKDECGFGEFIHSGSIIGWCSIRFRQRPESKQACGM